jgi:hypothetical protein
MRQTDHTRTRKKNGRRTGPPTRWGQPMAETNVNGNRRPRPGPEELEELLGPMSTTRERVSGLVALMGASRIAESAGVSESSVRNWLSGQAEPRSRTATTLDDLRSVSLMLLEGGLDVERIGMWLTSRDGDGLRPHIEIAKRPAEILTAASAIAMEGRLDATEDAVAATVLEQEHSSPSSRRRRTLRSV